MKQCPSKTLSRREMITSIGLLGGAALLSGCRHQSQAGADLLQPAANNPGPSAWAYFHLDPQEAADRAYRVYPDGSCMYGIVAAVLGMMAERAGEPYSSFPVDMMRYGAVGVAGWGSLCGVLNGGAALIGLFNSEKDTTQREKLTAELFTWYESTALPAYTPATPEWADRVGAAVPESVLCHISSAKWSQATGYSSTSNERRERCRRLTADGTAKVVDILNRSLGNPAQFRNISAETASCNSCHGPKGMSNSIGFMNCRSCHDLPSSHP